MHHEIRDRETLAAALRQGLRPKYTFFWGHRARRDGEIGKACLSQWWPADFTVDGVRYAAAEHFMMAQKARLFGDDEILARILATRDPGAAKKLGRQIQGFDGEVWEAARFAIVVAGNVAKFGQNPELRDFLLGTGERVLVEASPADRIWGIGLAEDDPAAENPDAWLGLNLLGFALMEARRRLRAGMP